MPCSIYIPRGSKNNKNNNNKAAETPYMHGSTCVTLWAVPPELEIFRAPVCTIIRPKPIRVHNP